MDDPNNKQVFYMTKFAQKISVNFIGKTWLNSDMIIGSVISEIARGKTPDANHLNQ